MNKFDELCVQQQPWRTIFHRFISRQSIAYYGVSEVLHVDSPLMGAASDGG